MPRVRRTSTRQTRHGRKHKVLDVVHVSAARWKRNVAHRVACTHAPEQRARQDGVSLKVRAGIGPRRDASIPLSISHPLRASYPLPVALLHLHLRATSTDSDSPLSPSYRAWFSILYPDLALAPTIYTPPPLLFAPVLCIHRPTPATYNG